MEDTLAKIFRILLYVVGIVILIGFILMVLVCFWEYVICNPARQQ